MSLLSAYTDKTVNNSFVIANVYLVGAVIMSDKGFIGWVMFGMSMFWTVTGLLSQTEDND